MDISLNGSKPCAHSRVVALGGGTGLPLLLRALVSIGQYPTAIVTMADDGGSSGRLRKELGIVPPGDVRNCLAALAGPDCQDLADMMGYRFDSGEGLSGHALGNLMLAALTDMHEGFKPAVERMEEVLSVQGCVLPSTYEDVTLVGRDREGHLIEGQALLAGNGCPLNEVALEPRLPRANPEALAALARADYIYIAPGSLFTSIIPNLLVEGVVEGIKRSKARVVYWCNVGNMRGETSGFTCRDHVEALNRHGLAGALDVVVVPEGPMVGDRAKTRHYLEAQGITPLFADVTLDSLSLHHDLGKVVSVLEGGEPCLLPQK